MWRPAHDLISRAALIIALAVMTGSAPAAAERLERIVSFNLCADQLVLALADRSQVAALSPFAADPSASVLANEAAGIPRIPPHAEATIALRPSAVLTGPLDRAAKRAVLHAGGIRIVEIGLVTSVDGAVGQIREVAAAIGRPERGEALIRRIEAARERLRAAAGPPATALLLERRGYAAGADSLAAALLREAGLHPPVGAPGGYGGFVSLERLLTLRPDIIVLTDEAPVASDQGALFLTHPALAKLYPQHRRLVLPHRFTMCGGAALIAALEHLTHAVATRSAPRDP